MTQTEFDAVECRRTVIGALATTMFDHEWSSYQEERRSNGLPATDECPRTPEIAFTVARLLVLRTELLNQKTIAQLVELAAAADKLVASSRYAREFGRALYYAATESRKWTDDHQPVKWQDANGQVELQIPHMTFAVSDQFSDDDYAYEVIVADQERAFAGSRAISFAYFGQCIRRSQGDRQPFQGIQESAEDIERMFGKNVTLSIQKGEEPEVKVEYLANGSFPPMDPKERVQDYFARISFAETIFDPPEDPYRTFAEVPQIKISVLPLPNILEKIYLGTQKRFILRFPQGSPWQAQSMGWPKTCEDTYDASLSVEEHERRVNESGALYTVCHHDFEELDQVAQAAHEVATTLRSPVGVFDLHQGFFVAGMLPHDGQRYHCNPLTGEVWPP